MWEDGVYFGIKEPREMSSWLTRTVRKEDSEGKRDRSNKVMIVAVRGARTKTMPR